MRAFLTIFAAVLAGNALLVVWLWLRGARFEPRIQPPSPRPAAVFHLHRFQMLASRDGRAWPMECWRVDANSEADAVEGILLAAHGVES